MTGASICRAYQFEKHLGEGLGLVRSLGEATG